MIAFFRLDTGRVVKVSNGHDAVPEGCGTVELDAQTLVLAREGRPLIVEASGIVEDLAPLEASLQARIDEQAGEALARRRTAGQAATDLRKQSEALLYENGADPALFPVLALEAAARGISLAEQAELVIVGAAPSVQALARINAARISAKLAVSAAADREAKLAAAIVDWEAAFA